MAITTEQIKELRDKTGISVMQCKKALEEAGGDMEKAVIILRKAGAASAAKKSDRSLGAGVITSYIHGTGSVGVMLELGCETDFVSGNVEFKAVAYDIAMHIAAQNPEFISMDEITVEAKAKAEEVFAKEVEGKPENMKAQILEGKLSSYFKERVLMEQPFIKNPEITIGELINGAIQKFGEKTQIVRFTRYSI
jgi:elongation factor Ts